MTTLSQAIPWVRRIPIPFSRDQAMLLMAAINEIFLGVDIFFAHRISGTIRPYEWIPIIFGPVAGVLLILAGIIALRRRKVATLFATLVFIASIVVGLLGTYFHLMRALLPNAPVGERVTVDLLVWAPPILGPLTFCLAGLLGLSAAWIEDPADSGVLRLLGSWRLRFPYSKTRGYFILVGLGTLATVVSSVLDHARTNFTNPWLWVPTLVGMFTMIVILTTSMMDKPNQADIYIYIATMFLLILVGVTGSALHISLNLASDGTIVGERFIRGAPFMAPLLFANMGTLGLVALMDPEEKVPLKLFTRKEKAVIET
ncbi:MAG: hypothetical protein ACM3PY_19815 [Omnitrophica WOR_2 bacterium]